MRLGKNENFLVKARKLSVLPNSFDDFDKRQYCKHILYFLDYFNPFPHLGHKPFENTVGKEKIAHNKQFLLFPQCFLPVWITFCHFHQI